MDPNSLVLELLAQRGYSRNHRPDCKQVCIALTFDGFPLGYEVFAGNSRRLANLADDRGDDGGAARRAGTRVDRR